MGRNALRRQRRKLAQQKQRSRPGDRPRQSQVQKLREPTVRIHEDVVVWRTNEIPNSLFYLSGEDFQGWMNAANPKVETLTIIKPHTQHLWEGFREVGIWFNVQSPHLWEDPTEVLRPILSEMAYKHYKEEGRGVLLLFPPGLASQWAALQEYVGTATMESLDKTVITSYFPIERLEELGLSDPAGLVGYTAAIAHADRYDPESQMVFFFLSSPEIPHFISTVDRVLDSKQGEPIPLEGLMLELSL